MPSGPLEAFFEAVHEIVELQATDLTPTGGAPIDPRATRVVGRASVVLLSSHFERYIYAVNEEASRALSLAGIPGNMLPKGVRLLHSKPVAESLVETSWERRGDALTAFIASETWLWTTGRVGFLDHDRLLAWMKTPTPRNLVRYYRYWGIEDIFGVITRRQHTRTDLRLKIDELVRKRNNIAHGDATTEATRSDVRSYREATRIFCERADRHLSRALRKLGAINEPW